MRQKKMEVKERQDKSDVLREEVLKEKKRDENEETKTSKKKEIEV